MKKRLLITCLSLVVLIMNAGCGGNDGKTVDDTTPIANTAPIADAGSDQEVSTGALVTLDGSASSDADGDALTYVWSLTSAPSGSSTVLTAADTAGPTFTPDFDGEYVLSLVVNDGTIASPADTMTVSASTANSAPVADAGSDQTLVFGTPATLDGSASSDTDSDSLTYTWSFVSVPAGSALTQLTDGATVAPSFTPDVMGAYVVQLIVSDGLIESPADALTVRAVSPFIAGIATTPQQVDGDLFSSIDEPQVAINDSGDIVAVWITDDGGEEESVYGNRYDAVGGTWTTPTLLETNDVAYPESLELAIDASGNAVAVWRMYNYYGINHIYANRYDAGDDAWGTAVVLDTTTQDTSYPDVGMDSAGNAIAVWLETLPSGNEAIISRRYDVNSDTWVASESLDYQTVNQWEPRVAVNASGSAIAVWSQQYGPLGNEIDVYAQLYDPDTGWGAGQRLDALPGDAMHPAQPAIDAAGNAVVIWKQNDDDNTPMTESLYANFYTAGDGLWGGSVLLETLSDRVESAPQVAMDGNGNAMTVWTHYNFTLDRDVYASRYDAADGWGTPVLLETDTAAAYNAEVVMDGSGNALAHWEHHLGAYSSAPAVPVINRYDAATDSWGGMEQLDDRGNESAIAANASGQAVIIWVKDYDYVYSSRLE